MDRKLDQANREMFAQLNAEQYEADQNRFASKATVVNDMKAVRVEHDYQHVYFAGRWWWKQVDIVRHPDYTARLRSTAVGYGNNAHKWYYAEYQMMPNFQRYSDIRFAKAPEAPF